MTTARYPTRETARYPSAMRGGGGVPALDADALDYFSRAEALGGSFDQSGLNALYTEAYVKSAISDFIAGCKTDAIWTKLTEVYLLTGVTFGGLMAKLKHAGTATLTNVGPFVSGDYLAAGSGAGLVKSESKTLTTGLPFSGMAITNISIGAYRTVAESTATTHTHFNFTSNTAQVTMVQVSGVVQVRIGTDTVSLSTGGSNGLLTGSRSGGTLSVYRNGSLVNSSGSAAGELPSGNLRLFDSGTNYRDSVLYLGTGLTDTDALNLSNRVNALMTALGANAY